MRLVWGRIAGCGTCAGGFLNGWRSGSCVSVLVHGKHRFMEIYYKCADITAKYLFKQRESALPCPKYTSWDPVFATVPVLWRIRHLSVAIMDRASIPSPTKTQHKDPYPAIDPTLPHLSQSGRVVLVTGSSSGIGYFIARAFAKAGAAAIVLTGRQETSLNDAADTLREQHPKTKIIAKVLDIADSLAVEQLWKSLDQDNIVIHVLVLSAARVQKPGPILEVGHAEILADFATNIGGNMVCTEIFYHQRQRNKDTKLVSKICVVLRYCFQSTYTPITGSSQRVEQSHPFL